MNMYLAAKMLTLSQFKEVYDRENLNTVPAVGTSVIFCAMANQVPENRYEIVKFLIDEGVDLKQTNAEKESLLHVLFSRPKHNMEQTVELTKLLLLGGVDINIQDTSNRVAIQYLITQPQISDSEFAPLYDVIFEHCNLDVSIKNAWGYTPLELAQKVTYRGDFLQRVARNG